jgi:hypothetical protein
MNRSDVTTVLSILLFISLAITGLLGYLQSELELRKFIPHRYFAYTTLTLAAIHVILHWKKVWRFICKRPRVNPKAESDLE